MHQRAQPSREHPLHHDACGLGFLARISGEPSHDILARSLEALARLEHRGAVTADGKSGDGAGILTQVPDHLVRRWLGELGAHSGGRPVAVGQLFLPAGDEEHARAREIITGRARAAGFDILGWRDVPFDPTVLGPDGLRSLPIIRQIFIAPEFTREQSDREAIERELYLIRRGIQRDAAAAGLTGRCYVASLSLRTLGYKAMCRASTLADFYTDLRDPDYRTAGTTFHRRFSTNTAPAWHLVQPLRMCAHNGEFNTLQGNISWLKAREPHLASPLFGDRIQDLIPLADPSDSDSVTFDRVFEILVRGGRDPEAVMAMLCPEPYAHMPDMDPSVRAMCRYFSELIEPWDGPAAILFFDGRTIGAGLDRNGLRPLRYAITRDGLICGGSETGFHGFEPASITTLGKLGPGQIIAVDLASREIRTNDEIKSRAASKEPFLHWVEQGLRTLPVGADDKIRHPSVTHDLLPRQLAFGYSREDIERILGPMHQEAKSPVGSMGDDTPLAALSRRPQLIYRFFKQRFAQVTNPPIDSVRERLNMSLETSMSRYANILEDSPEAVRLLRLDSPVISDRELDLLCDVTAGGERTTHVHALFNPKEGAAGLERSLEALCDVAVAAVRAETRVLVISDRSFGDRRAPIPMLLAVSAVHHRLVDAGLRTECSIIAETGEAREDHHVACLIGFGATLVLPYLAFETVAGLAPTGRETEALQGYRRALEQGLLKILSKMGVTVIQSYRGARLFEIVGLDASLVARYFPGTPNPIGGTGLARIAGDQAARHAAAFASPGEAAKLTEEGTYRFRAGGETHANAPAVFKALHKAVRTGSKDEYEKYLAAAAGLPAVRPRDLLRWTPLGSQVPLDEVEPAPSIAKRLCIQAMSHGALSAEVHELLGVAASRLGTKSSSGEGGEMARRFTPYTDVTVNGSPESRNPPPTFPGPWSPRPGDHANSTIKQIAAGRFGVDAHYLASATEIEIKMAQGAKPGEGGQIPGFKVTAEIASIRHTVEGTPLISPPPHHDIYSIEDLAQLIHDLKCVNPRAEIGVKLVATSGVGTIACGVAKAGADVIIISGADGGTGAAQLSSIKHAGISWEMGLSRTQDLLSENGLRARVRLRADGGMATGRDVVTAALFGADEVGFGTTALIAAGCVMARKCHDNTCPVGVATQDPKLRAKLPGTPEHVVALLMFIAEEVRLHLATLGARAYDEIVGRRDLLECDRRDDDDPGPAPLDVSALCGPAGDMHNPDVAGRDRARRWAGERNATRGLSAQVDEALLHLAAPALDRAEPVSAEMTVTNTDLSIGARLAGEIGRRRLEGSPARPAAIDVTCRGTAGQSFGAFCKDPIQLTLVGDAQEGVGKGMSGGRIAIRPHQDAGYDPHDSHLAGNTVLYGATGGEFFCAGRVGERFAVRNSGAVAVIEGCGDHGCEYMTGGRVAIIGPIGRNFAAGMTGGVAYVLDHDRYLERHCNMETVRVDRGRDDQEAEELRELIARHHAQTESTFARTLLGDWTAWRARFHVVRPLRATEPAHAAKPVASDARAG